jgi:hypothetical protein
LGVNPAFSVEAIHIFTKDGILKVLGTVVCVSGAILMALYRGPALIGLGGNSTSGTCSSNPYPAHWLTSTMFEYGVETWHLGVLCLLGNCLLVAAYLIIQVMQISELALDPAFSLVGLIFIDQILFNVFLHINKIGMPVYCLCSRLIQISVLFCRDHYRLP